MNKFMIALWIAFLFIVLLMIFWMTVFIGTWIPAVQELKSACLACGGLK